MGIREKIQENKGLGVGLSVAFVVIAAAIVYVELMPQKKPNLAQAWYTDDDGKSWFADSMFKTTPFDHGGKPAVGAVIFSYANGSKQYCAWESKYTDDAKKQLDAAFKDAEAKGQPLSSVALLGDRSFTDGDMMVKLPGPDSKWVPLSSPEGTDVQRKGLVAPDGGHPTDQVMVY